LRPKIGRTVSLLMLSSVAPHPLTNSRAENLIISEAEHSMLKQNAFQPDESDH
jgi:hypothetical protein